MYPWFKFHIQLYQVTINYWFSQKQDNWPVVDLYLVLSPRTWVHESICQ
jgi:hypothetical protein